MKRLFGAALLVVAAACSGNKEKTLPVATATVQRRDIIIDAQASGVVEPIAIVEVKSKASGMVTQVAVETGTMVRPGDLLVQVDTRDVNNQLEQAKADLEAAQARYDVSVNQKKRSDDMFAAKVITAQEHETAALELRNANTALVRARTNLDLAQQRLDDARVTASIAGTVIEKTVSPGVVIASATGSVSGGTTLLKMANLEQVRVRALFNESDIGLIRGGQTAAVNVDAYQNRPFTGLVEKIEPQAVIQQNVTMFPVLITLDNREGLLKPGMNGEVTVTVSELPNVLAVPNDAVRNVREASAIATMLGLNPDSVNAEIRAQQGGRGNGMGGGRTGSAGGDVALEQDQQSGRRGSMPQVTAEECKAIDAAIAKKPAEKKKIDDIRAKMSVEGADRRALNAELQPIYQAIGVDARKVGACRMQGGGRGGNGGATGPNAATTAATTPQRSGAVGAAPRANGQAGQLTPSPELGGQSRRPRSGLVFVATDTLNKSFAPRVLQLGQGNFDYTEVLSGLKEGDRVVLISALQLQANRQAQNERTRANMGVPGLNPNAGGGRGPGGGGAPPARGGGGGGRGG
ncbi:MAG TPA: efflux RND transporter periplasmic adaptor subunit [Gemmatimonadaceae bacterium]|nr:efflux RND transporter periplasmic adaptor subunit [Gemmatimonadaceae bacterium]